MKLKRINKRGQDGGSEIIVKILLALIVLALVFIFLFRNYIWDYVRNLPGNKYDNRDSIVTNITKDQVILSNYYKVAKIIDGKYIKLCTKGDCNNLRDTKLYLSGDDRSGIIYADVNWAFDKQVGSMVNSKLVIDKDIILGKGVYEKVKDDLPSYTDLKNLDGSLYISGIFYRDSEYEVKEGERVFGTLFSYTDKADSNFSEKVNKMQEEDVLIVNISSNFGKYKITNVQFERTGDLLRVFATYIDSNGKEQPVLMDCNKNGWSWQTKFLNINKVNGSVLEILESNCKKL